MLTLTALIFLLSLKTLPHCYKHSNKFDGMAIQLGTKLVAILKARTFFCQIYHTTVKIAHVC